MNRPLGLLGGTLGLSGVALGAFGAHGLKASLAGLAEASERLGFWETGARYHLIHAVAVLALAAMPRGRLPLAAGSAFAAGVAIFSGTLYAMALGAPRWFGAITPLGGLAFLTGWALVIAAAARAGATASPPPGH
ncbi:MAG: DUF423 domain-containing protein [Myxococcaceae bacterium]|nr:DUF423 domain-containing protein [Myxococcaceae bacterium]